MDGWSYKYGVGVDEGLLQLKVGLCAYQMKKKKNVQNIPAEFIHIWYLSPIKICRKDK